MGNSRRVKKQMLKNLGVRTKDIIRIRQPGRKPIIKMKSTLNSCRLMTLVYGKDNKNEKKAKQNTN